MPSLGKLSCLALLFALFAFPAKAQIVNAGGGGVTSTSNAPSVINIKNATYGGGAFGDSQEVDTCTVNTSTTLVCTGAGFSSPADVGKSISCALNFTQELHPTTIASVTNSTTVVTVGTSLNNTGGVSCVWGHPDDTAFAAAVAVWLSCNSSVNPQGGNVGASTAPCVLYAPTGNYMLLTEINGAINSVAAINGLQFYGDGVGLTRFYIPSEANFSSASAVFSFGGNSNAVYIHDMTIDGANGNFVAIPIFNLAGLSKMVNVSVLRALNSTALSVGAIFYGDTITFTGNSKGFVCSACQGGIQNWIFSNNNNGNMVISNVSGPPSSIGFIIGHSGLQDECGSNPFCGEITNSVDVWLLGTSLFATASGSCLQIDGLSYVHWNGGMCTVFGTDTNASGPIIAAGSTLQASDVRFMASPTGTCMTNNGLFKDYGGNTCGTRFKIASGTSTTTTAVLTSTVSGVSTACAVGDTLVVENAAISGYNGYYAAGITAVTASTVTYTTIGSGMGALAAGGVFTCQNVIKYAGNLPVTSLTPSWNTCYNTLGTVATIVVCKQFIDRAMNIYHMTASSNATTTCATAPIVTISDGTRTQSLTLTTGKSSWDTTVDTAVGFPAIPVVGTNDYKRAGTLTMTYDLNGLAACATPPTNLSVTYNAMSILDNQ